MNSRNAYGNDCWCALDCDCYYILYMLLYYILYYTPYALYSTLYSLRSYSAAVEYNLVPHSDVKWDSTNYIITLNILPHAGIQGGNVELQ